MKVKRVNSVATLKENRDKVVTIDELEGRGVSYIFTKGVFDIIHAGHLSLFSYLERIKDDHRLVVCVTSDRVTTKKKGKCRPVNDESTRMDQISSMSVVDYVIKHDEESYVDAIDRLKPAIYVKGMDTAMNNEEDQEMHKNNPELSKMTDESLFIIFCDDGSLSTSKTIEKIISTNVADSK